MRSARAGRRRTGPARTFAKRIRGLTLELLEDRQLLTAVGLSAQSAFDQLTVDSRAHRDGTLLVQFRPEATAADQAAAEMPGADLGAAWPIAPGLREVNLEPGADFAAALAAYQANPNVLFVEPDYRVQLNWTPNDPQFGTQWDLNNTGQNGGTPDADIDAPEAWDVTTGSSSVIVAVIDTGVDYNHPDLAANMWTNMAEKFGAPNVDDDGNGYVDDIHGYDFANRDGDPMDDFFHGTHVAGTIGAVGNNGIGISGINWHVQIMALKFLDSSGGGYTSDAIEALNYAVANGATISNNSWGGGEYSQAFQAALQNAAAHGHIFVAAAGNNGENTDLNPFYPAGYNVDNVVSVGASDQDDNWAYFSNIGAHSVDLFAPGVNILSTFPTQMTQAMADEGLSTNYGTISGTSMATPHVTGVMALVRGQHPDWTADQVIEQVLGTVDVLPELRDSVTSGRLNAAAAVGNIPVDTIAPRVVSSTPNGGVTGPVSQVRLQFSESIDAASFTTDDVQSFVGPNGPISAESVVPVAGSSKLFDVTFAPQTVFGDYTLIVGPDIRDRAGNPLADAYTATFSILDVLIVPSTDVPAPINPWMAVGSFLTVDQDVSIADLNVRLNISHPQDGDLAMYLIAPNGNSTYLTYFAGGSGADFQDTLFDDEAGASIYDGVAPFTGSYRPDSPLSVFDGASAQGEWQLWIEDWGFFDEGTLNGWSLEITPAGSSGDPGDPGDPPPPPPPPPPPVNQPPNAGYDDLNGTEDTPLVVPASVLLANDWDPDGDSLSITAVGNASGGSVVLNANGTVTFTPLANFNVDHDGYASFEYTLSDGHGHSQQGYVNVIIAAVNDPPIAVNDSFPTSGGVALTLLTGDLLANDLDVDGDGLSVTAVSGATGGTVSLNKQQGTVKFTPTSGFLGQAGFNYTISDGHTTASAHVTITIREVYYLSLTDPATLTNSDGTTLSVSDADIVQLSILGGGAYRYSMYFDGSDVGLNAASEDIDAFSILSDGSIILSTVGAYSIPYQAGTLTGGGNNLLIFYPRMFGDTTDGDWLTYYNGVDMGLTGSAENIDAVTVLSDYSLIISTSGNVSVPGVTGVDADLLKYDNGTWRMYFDASDVGLTTADEDVDAVYVRESPTGGQPQIFLSTRGDFSVTGASGANEDVLAFSPTRLGGTTAGSFAMPFDGSLYGLANLDIDGIYVGQAPGQELVGGAAGASSLGASSLAASPAAAAVPGAAAGSDLSAMASAMSLLIATPPEALTPRPPKGPATVQPPVIEAPPSPDPAGVDLLLGQLAGAPQDNTRLPPVAAAGDAPGPTLDELLAPPHTAGKRLRA